MDEYNRNYSNWDNGSYGTGPTQPPKSRGGLIALLLILVIFLCGIVTVLGVLNIRLFQALRMQQEGEPIVFASGADTGEAASLEDALTRPTEPQNGSVDMEQSAQGIENLPEDGGMSLQDIYTQTIPSVVSVSCVTASGASTGTGVVLTAEGFIVTNAHVAEGAQSITVQLTDGRELSAWVVGMDLPSDLAVLRVEAEDLTPARFGDSDRLRVGDTVVAIGDPLGVKFRGTYTDGIVSAINRNVDVDGHAMTLIQTNAALNAGNSGGPLINCYGQIIGINTMKIGMFASSSGVEGLGFAIPSATVLDVTRQLMEQGYVSGRPTLGIQGEKLGIRYQYYYRLSGGLFITQVDERSDAWEKGIRERDILLSLAGTPVSTMAELRTVLNGRQVGDTLEAVIFRGGQQYVLELTLTEDKG